MKVTSGIIQENLKKTFDSFDDDARRGMVVDDDGDRVPPRNVIKLRC